MTKELCGCGKIAVWDYMPGFSSGDSPYFCDDCVPRGCECNYIFCGGDAYHPELDHKELPTDGVENIDWKWIDKGNIWTRLDDESREYPCSEYNWDPDGYERNINPHEL